MNNKEFKEIFSNTAKNNGFESAFGGWYTENSECITVLELQKSNYGDYYMLNIKVFIQGSFNRNYSPTKELIKSPMGNITKQIIDDVLSFDKPMDDDLRIKKLKELFTNDIIPFTSKTATRAGIEQLESTGQIKLLPAVKEELDRLIK